LKAPEMKIKCSVTNCIYNQNRMCHADSLQVDSMGDGIAETIDGTCCSPSKTVNSKPARRIFDFIYVLRRMKQFRPSFI
jgi:hypothetical protein